MRNFSDWTIEELVAAAGTLLSDLRGDWSNDSNYNGRIEELIAILITIREYPDTKEEEFLQSLKGNCDWSQVANRDFLVAHRELNTERDHQDGRMFRYCYFYCLIPEKGMTERVKEYLLGIGILSHPEYEWVNGDDNRRKRYS